MSILQLIMSTQSNIENDLVNKLLQEVKILNNIGFILEKINNEGFLMPIHQTLTNLLDNEVKFTIGELFKIHQKIEFQEIKNQLVNNTYIFKENLKNIIIYLSKIKS